VRKTPQGHTRKQKGGVCWGGPRLRGEKKERVHGGNYRFLIQAGQGSVSGKNGPGPYSIKKGESVSTRPCPAGKGGGGGVDCEQESGLFGTVPGDAKKERVGRPRKLGSRVTEKR